MCRVCVLKEQSTISRNPLVFCLMDERDDFTTCWTAPWNSVTISELWKRDVWSMTMFGCSPFVFVCVCVSCVSGRGRRSCRGGSSAPGRWRWGRCEVRDERSTEWNLSRERRNPLYPRLEPTPPEGRTENRWWLVMSMKATAGEAVSESVGILQVK